MEPIVDVRLTMAEYQAHKEAGTLPKLYSFRADDDEPEPATVSPSPSPPAAGASAGRGRGKRGGGKGIHPNRSSRFATLNAFVDFGMTTGKLNGAEVKVWLILFRDTKGNGTARTGQADIARRAGLDERTVRRAIASLAKKGFVGIVLRGKLNAGPSTYRVHPTGNP